MKVFTILVTAMAVFTTSAFTTLAHEKHNNRHLFHVTGPKSSFDALFRDPLLTNDHPLDIWRIRPLPTHSEHRHQHHQSKTHEPWLQAEILATTEAIHALTASTLDIPLPVHGHGRFKAIIHQHPQETFHFHVEKSVKHRSEAERVQQDRLDVAACLNQTQGYLETLLTLPQYVDSLFFDCFRPYDQVFAFFDALTHSNPSILTKMKASTTFQGRSIAAYRVSLPPSTPSRSKKALYTQALIHAREWQAGAATFYTLTKLIDKIRAQDPHILKLFDNIDWYFVPIVNIDGYQYTWDEDRYYRVNRDEVTTPGFSGIDLNRNWGPDEYFNLEPSQNDAETNPGPRPYSEPSTAGLYEFITTLHNVVGIVDMHGYGGMVLRPFSDATGPPPEPFGSGMQALGDAVRDALGGGTRTIDPGSGAVLDRYGDPLYVSEPSGALYPAYGCFDDAFFRYYNFTVPTLTIEVEGEDFIASQSTIRHVGNKMYHGLIQFVKETKRYQEYVQKQGQDNQEEEEEEEELEIDVEIVL